MGFDKKEFKKKMKAKGITQDRLGKILDKSPRQIARWLGPKQRLKHEVIEQLCYAIDESPDIFDASWSDNDTSTQKVRVNAHISHAAMNGYYILKFWYGVSQKDLIELAPTMFAILAEKAILAPTEREQQSIKDKQIAELLGLHLNSDYHEEEQYPDQYENPKQKGDEFRDKHARAIFGHTQGYNNPFENILNRLSSENASPGKVTQGYCPTSIGATFNRKLINVLTNLDLELSEAIWQGDIPLYKIDVEVLKSPEARIAWFKKEQAKAEELKEIKKQQQKSDWQKWRKENPKQAAERDREFERLTAQGYTFVDGPQ